MGMLKNPARWSAFSYTHSTGKKPSPDGFSHGISTWFIAEISDDEDHGHYLPAAVFDRLKGGERDESGWVDYPTYFDAIAAANDAARLAIQDGAMKLEVA